MSWRCAPIGSSAGRSAEHDLVAMAHDAARGIARVDDQLSRLDNRGVIITGVVGGDDHAVIASSGLPA